MNTLENNMNVPENAPNGYNTISNFGSAGNNQDKSKDQQETKYQCPMNCEGNKTYNQPGVCPVCNMQLVLVGEAKPECC